LLATLPPHRVNDLVLLLRPIHDQRLNAIYAQFQLRLNAYLITL
jgi:hypothetical protein